jgi:hypothetical protein
MKILQSILAVASVSFVSVTQAQNEMPKSYTKGSIILPDSSIVSGYVKDNIRKNAAVAFINENQKKANYSGADILSVTIGSENYICIKGDFFKTICNGKLCFLQKMSDASGKPSYNGSEAVFASGTVGVPGDYFIYETKSKELKLVTKKNITNVAVTSFAGCNEAIEKSKTITGDVSQLKDAVVVYNNSSDK